MAMATEDVVQQLLEAKEKQGKTFSQIADELGLTNAYVGQLFHRQAALPRDQVAPLRLAVPSLSDELLEAMQVIPLQSVPPLLVQDPTVYRFHEAVVQYAATLKAIINEEFGDGVMSESDLRCELQKIRGEDGEVRVRITMNGRFIPYEIPQGDVPLPPFEIKEATISEMQAALRAGTLTSRKLVDYYTERCTRLNPKLNAVIKINPAASKLADDADNYRLQHGSDSCKGLRGIPILLKDNIATANIETTAGSLALVDSVAPRDAGIVSKLSDAGAIIFGKANLSEWMNFRSPESYHGWSAVGKQTMNPYDPDQTTCGSSSGSAVAASANMVAVTVGTETNGSIICPSSFAAVVGIKPTVGLTSRAGVIPLSRHQDSVGPICRTVADAVEVLDVIVGADERDPATAAAAAYIPTGGYKQFLKSDGLRGKRLGALTGEYFVIDDLATEMDELYSLAESQGAVIIKDLELPNAAEIISGTNEKLVFMIDFKQELNEYLADLTRSKVRTLQDVIQFNKDHKEEELSLFGQELLLEAQAKEADQHSEEYKNALARNKVLTEEGLDYLFKTHQLDAVVAVSASAIAFPAAIAGYPGITVPAGYVPPTNFPYGICFLGSKGSEGVLIEIAYAFEQASRKRKPPPLDKLMELELPPVSRKRDFHAFIKVS